MNQSFQNINLSYNHVAIAEFGGPIAMTRNKELFIMGKRDNTTKDRIVFFDATGKKMT